MNDDEKELVKVGAEAAFKPFSDLIDKLFGGPAEELGGILQDSLKVRRFARQLKLYKETQRLIVGQVLSRRGYRTT